MAFAENQAQQYYQQYPPIQPNQKTYPNPYANNQNNQYPNYQNQGQFPQQGYQMYQQDGQIHQDYAQYQTQQTFQSQGYQYNPNTPVQAMTVDDWKKIQAESTDYSKYWENESSFEPETFSQNIKKEHKCNDCCWAVLFWINFIVFIIFMIVSLTVGKDNMDNYFDGTAYASQLSDTTHVKKTALSSTNSVDAFNNLIAYTVGFGLLIGVVLTILHSLYCTLVPMFYIKFGFWMLIIISFLCCIPGLLFGSFLILIFPLLTAIIALITYCCVKKYIPFSAAVMKQSCFILWKNPSVFFLLFVEIVFEIGISLLFIFSALYYIISEWSYFGYIYYLFGYYWIMETINYIVYMTIAGVASQFYFLSDTEYYPRHPVWASFKRAATSSFGSAALAGFLMAVVNVCQSIANEASREGGLIAVLACIARCILCIIECFLNIITKYALIYCATFGVPFKEGCRRWLELESKLFVGTLVNSCIISTAIDMNSFIFGVGGGAIGLGLSFLLMDNDILLIIFLTLAGFILTLCFISLTSTPIITFADTLFVCFCEHPENLKTTAYELYEKIVDIYGHEIQTEIKKDQRDK